MRKKRIVLQISIAYNEITSCVVTLREMEKKFFDILRIVQKNPVFGKTLMCGGMLDEKRMEILYEILYAIDRGELTDTRNDIFQYGSLIGKKDLLARQIFLCLLEKESVVRLRITREEKVLLHKGRVFRIVLPDVPVRLFFFILS